MKVLGIADAQSYRDPTYIVQISHDELTAAFEKSYSNKLEVLKVGQELNLGSIPDQRARIVEATKAMETAYQRFVQASPVMAEFVRIVAAAAPAAPTPTEEGKQ